MNYAKKIINSIKASVSLAKGIQVQHKYVFNQVQVAIAEEYGLAGTGNSNIPFAVVTKGELYAFIKSNIIVVNNAFLTLSKATQECLLWHEIGHVKLGHLDQKRSHFLYILERIFKEPQIEIDADGYAIDKVGKEKFISALVELNQHMKTRAIRKRIERIKRNN